MIHREINILLNEMYTFNRKLGGMEYKNDNWGQDEDIFQEYFKEFKLKL